MALKNVAEENVLVSQPHDELVDVDFEKKFIQDLTALSDSVRAEVTSKLEQRRMLRSFGR